MLKHRFMHLLVALTLIASMVGQGTGVLAGTTGGLSGTVVESGATTGIANAKVTATSPSQTTSTNTDAQGKFGFISLAPDTYTLSIEKQGYDATSLSGVNVLADQTQNITLATRKTLREIQRVTSRASTELVKPGTTADVYSISATQQDKFSALGGGGGLNNAYSAIASVPGTYVPLNQAGYFQTIHIRGGDYNQVGYELDGVPINRSFDNYPSGTASSLGQQELQVYTGAAPANAESQGISGFINQVIRTGTYPGFGTLSLGIGGPAFYHKANFETGGATPSRNFSYYAGVGAYNQDFRGIDQGNGQYATAFGLLVTQLTPPGGCGAAPLSVAQNFSACYANGSDGPGGYTTAPQDFAQTSDIAVRDSVVNLHFGFPHRNDAGKDDVQLLYLNNFIRSSFFTSTNDLGAVALNGAVPNYIDGFQYNGTLAAPLPANYQALTARYLFPSSRLNRAAGASIGSDTRDTYQNDQAILKLQYQKNIGSNAYFRIYGYTYYSDWLINGPNFAWQAANTALTGVSRDYELSSHTRGISASFADQINPKHLLQLTAAYTTATTLRDNNRQMNTASGTRSRFAVAVDPNNPTNGICYKVAGATALPAACGWESGTAVRATYATLPQAFAGTIPTISAATCGTGPCTFYVVENGLHATYNQVTPKFTAFSVTDVYKPTDRLVLNLGLRYDNYEFQGSDTTGTPARALFFNAYNQDYCLNAAGVPVLKAKVAGPAFLTPCPAGRSVGLVNASAETLSYNAFQPRVGGTYTFNPDTVIRASYGRYAQAPNTAFEQYNTLQQNLPSLIGGPFVTFGFKTPGHVIRPQVSNNYDLSFERHIRGSDMSFKVTPYYRVTKDEIHNFFLDQPSNFVSGLNASNLTTRGVEFQFNKGDFGREGWAGQLAFTYTNAYSTYNTFANGSTPFTGINDDIAMYNGYTKGCVGSTSPLCGGKVSPNAVPCFTTAGTPDAACAAGSIANPYFNAPTQGLVDPGGRYTPFTLLAGGVGSITSGYVTPYVAALIVQYKKGKLAITPSMQFAAGNRYGVPESTTGIDPAAGCGALAGSVVGDPRYPYGAPGGAPYNAVSCNASLPTIPNPFTGRFDGIGEFVQPSNLTANLQVAYEASPKISFVATFANIVNTCFGGSSKPWTVSEDNNVCSYGLIGTGNVNPVGNVYNPGSTIQPVLQYPYQRLYGPFNTNSSPQPLKAPFTLGVEARFKL